jgi:plastocyanin
MKRVVRAWMVGALVGCTLLATVGVAQARTQAQPAATVEILGGVTLVPEESITADWRFAPVEVTVASGETIRWENNADLPAPHTVTLVKQSKLPQDLAGLDACYAPGEPCSRALNRHGPRRDRKIVVEDEKDAEIGLDEPRDSRWIKGPIGSALTARVSADAGTTLYYLCAIHPWMQGRIVVQ